MGSARIAPSVIPLGIFASQLAYGERPFHGSSLGIGKAKSYILEVCDCECAMKQKFDFAVSSSCYQMLTPINR